MGLEGGAQRGREGGRWTPCAHCRVQPPPPPREEDDPLPSPGEEVLGASGQTHRYGGTEFVQKGLTPKPSSAPHCLPSHLSVRHDGDQREPSRTQRPGPSHKSQPPPRWEGLMESSRQSLAVKEQSSRNLDSASRPEKHPGRSLESRGTGVWAAYLKYQPSCNMSRRNSSSLFSDYYKCVPRTGLPGAGPRGHCREPVGVSPRVRVSP